MFGGKGMSRKKQYLYSFFIPIIVMTCVYSIAHFYPFSDKTITSGDFLLQYMPLYKSLSDTIRQKDFLSFFWSFKKGLGGAMASVYGFNSLSPFTLLYSIVPVHYYSEVTLFITVLRYGLCSVAMVYFLRNRPTNHQKLHDGLVIISGITYGLSGFLLSQQFNPNFLDNLVLLPITMLGVEKILTSKHSKSYPLLLALMMIINFYTGYMTCLLIVIYGLGYVIGMNVSFRESVKSYFVLAIYSMVGVGLSSFWLIPVFFNLLESKASAQSVFDVNLSVLYQPWLLMTKLFIGAIDFEEWGDPSARPQIYIALVNVFGVVHYFVSSKISKRRKQGACFILLVIMSSFLIHFFDQIWHMGQRPVGFYFRNSWIFTFIAITLSYDGLNEEMRISRKEWIVLIAVFSIVAIMSIIKSITYLNNQQIFLTIVIIILLGWVLTNATLRRSVVLRVILTMTLIELTVTGYLATIRAPYHISQESILNRAELSVNESIQSLNATNSFARVQYYQLPSQANSNFFSSTTGVTHFTSSLEYVFIYLYGKLGLPSSTAMINYIPNPVTDALFNLHYFIDQKTLHSQTQDLLKWYEVYQQYDEQHTIFYNPYTLNGGFLTSQQVVSLPIFDETNPIDVHNLILKNLFESEEEFYRPIQWDDIISGNLDVEGDELEQIDALSPITLTYYKNNLSTDKLYMLHIPKSSKNLIDTSTITMNGAPYTYQDRFNWDQIWSVSPDIDGNLTFSLTNSTLNKISSEFYQLYEFDIERFKNEIDLYKKYTLDISKVTNHQLVMQIEIEDDNFNQVFLSIPYNQGWHVKANDQLISTYRIWNSFLGFELPIGTYNVLVYYYPKGLNLGLLVSVISILAMMFITKFKLFI